jgi:hypothetical protein
MDIKNNNDLGVLCGKPIWPAATPAKVGRDLVPQFVEEASAASPESSLRRGFAEVLPERAVGAAQSTDRGAQALGAGKGTRYYFFFEYRAVAVMHAV